MGVNVLVLAPVPLVRNKREDVELLLFDAFELPSLVLDVFDAIIV